MNYVTDYEKQQYILREKLRDADLLDIFINNNALICGGAVRSVFANERIEDFDVYFLDEKSAISFNSEIAVIMGEPAFISDNAITYSKDGLTIQSIQSIMGIPMDIIDQFDYTICMSAYSCKRRYFSFGETFFEDLAGRQLIFNVYARYPISSLFRIKKYLARGYKISGVEMVKIALCIHRLNLSDYNILRDQLMGIDVSLLSALMDTLSSEEYGAREYDFKKFMGLLDSAYAELLDITF